MEAERWRGQLRVLGAIIAVAVSVSYGTSLLFEWRRRNTLKQLVEAQQELQRELKELRAQMASLGAPRQVAGRTVRGQTQSLPLTLTSAGGAAAAADVTSDTNVKSDDEEFFEFSEA